MESLRKLVVDKYTFAGQIHNVRFVDKQKSDVIHTIKVFDEADAYDELKYRASHIQNQENGDYNIVYPTIPKHHPYEITSYEQIPINNADVTTTLCIDILPIDVIDKIGEDVLLGTVMRVESSRPPKRSRCTTTHINKDRNFDHRNYVMTEDTTKKTNMLNYYSTYYKLVDPDYYADANDDSHERYFSGNTTIHVDDVYNYGNEAYDRYNSKKMEIDDVSGVHYGKSRRIDDPHKSCDDDIELSDDYKNMADSYKRETRDNRNSRDGRDSRHGQNPKRKTPTDAIDIDDTYSHNDDKFNKYRARKLKNKNSTHHNKDNNNEAIGIDLSGEYLEIPNNFKRKIGRDEQSIKIAEEIEKSANGVAMIELDDK